MANRYRYTADAGLAAQHVDDLSAEMRGLDMPPGTEVSVAGHDHHRDLVLVEWADGQSNPRITSVDPAFFAEHFQGA